VSVSEEKSLIGPTHHAQQRIHQQFVDVTGCLYGTWDGDRGGRSVGGSSGMSSLKALQTASSQTETPEFDKSIYNPSGMYGMKAMDPSAPEYQYPGQVGPSTHNPQLFSGQKEKSMVELSPVVVPMPGENKQMSFNRFMAVP